MTKLFVPTISLEDWDTVLMVSLKSAKVKHVSNVLEIRVDTNDL